MWIPLQNNKKWTIEFMLHYFTEKLQDNRHAVTGQGLNVKRNI